MVFRREGPFWWLTIVSLSWFMATPVSAAELQNSAQADELCRYASAIESSTRTENESQSDLVFQALNRRQYRFTRSARLMEAYSVSLDARLYRFLPDEHHLLTVDTLNPFSLFDGEYQLDLGEAVELNFSESEEQLEAILAGFSSDQVLLRLFFQLSAADNPALPFCQETGAGTTRISGRLLSAELVARPRYNVLARYETARHQDRAVRFGMSRSGEYLQPRPNVLVSDTHFLAGSASNDEAEYLRLEAEGRAMACYQQGLNFNGRLQGAIVLSYRINSEGLVERPAVLFDAVNHSMLTGCVTRVIGHITIPRRVPEGTYEVRMNMIFRLE